MEKARGFFRKILSLIKKPEMRILPGQLAFFIVMSLIPAVAIIGAVATTFSIPVNTITLNISESVPKEISDVLLSFISGKGLNFNIIVFFISTFILASNGTHSMIITSNEIYKIKPRDILSRRLKAIIMIFILVVLFFFLLVVPVFGDSLFELLKIILKDEATVEFFHHMFQILKYPLVIITIYFNVKLVYVTAPDRRIPSNTTTKGAIFTTICWIIATEIYTFYIRSFSTYSIFYGSLSNLLILLIWVYILSYIFVLGMGINASVYEESIEGIEK